MQTAALVANGVEHGYGRHVQSGHVDQIVIVSRQTRLEEVLFTFVVGDGHVLVVDNVLLDGHFAVNERTDLFKRRLGARFLELEAVSQVKQVELDINRK